jgi:ABC-type sugar transport system permease subunit
MSAVSAAGGSRRRVQLWCLAFLLPGLVLGGLFTFYPMVMSWYYSLVQWNGFGSASTFVGLDNYRKLVHDSYFWAAFGRSFLFVVVAVPVRLGLALLVAIVLNNQALKLSKFYRTFFFLPVVTASAIVGIVMTFVLSPFHGPVNQALQHLSIVGSPVDFLGNSHTALWSIMGVEVWKDFGISMIYWLAALQTVPKEYQEAAAVDGANAWQTFARVTAPILLPFAAIIVVLTANNTLHLFALVQSMTQGGPYYATQVIEVFIYQTGFASENSGGVPQLGYASAAGCLFGLAVMVIALLQLWAVKRANNVRGQLAGAR